MKDCFMKPSNFMVAFQTSSGGRFQTYRSNVAMPSNNISYSFQKYTVTTVP